MVTGLTGALHKIDAFLDSTQDRPRLRISLQRKTTERAASYVLMAPTIEQYSPYRPTFTDFSIFFLPVCIVSSFWVLLLGDFAPCFLTFRP